jgi:hypothetical protein
LSGVYDVEHGVYICTWTQSSDGMALWIKSRPWIRASAPTYDEAEELLIEAIQNAGGAIQEVLEFDPPLPKSASDLKYRRPGIYLFGADDRFETNAPRRQWGENAQELDERLRWNDEFYETPLCRKCKFTSGRRSDKPLTLSYAPVKYDGAFGFVGMEGGPTHRIVSKEFLALLTADEKRSLNFQPTIRKGRRKFYELIGPAGPPLVAVAGMKISGWRCTECDQRTWGYWIDGMAIDSFIARSDLPAPLPGVFTVGVSPEVHLAVTESRLKELVGRKGTRGFVSRPLGIVAKHEVVRRPDLPTIEEQLPERFG